MSLELRQYLLSRCSLLQHGRGLMKDWMSSPGRALEYLIPLVQVRHHKLSMYLTCRDGETQAWHGAMHECLQCIKAASRCTEAMLCCSVCLLLMYGTDFLSLLS